jgi:Holliday junction resolvase RusA-like endonuclease
MPKAKSADGPLVAWCIAETTRLRALGLDGILVLPVPPSANAIWRKAKRGMYKIDSARQFEAQVSIIMQAFKVKPITGPCALSILWFRSARQGDTSNKIKALEDAVKNVLIEDDRHVAALRIERVEGCPTPHVRIMAYKWTPRIFPDWQDSFPMTEVA